MTIRSETYAFTRPVPYLLVRGVAQTIAAPIRHGATGALVIPTESGSTITVQRSDGTYLLSDVQISDVLSGEAVHDLALIATTEVLGEGWEVVWSLIMPTGTFAYRTAAYLCEYVPPNVISVLDLYTRVPELQYRIPQRQGDSGDGTGWQPQIDEAYYELMRRLVDDGKRPWLIREVTGYREWLLARAVQLAVNAVPGGPEAWTGKAARDAHFEVAAAAGRMRLQYATESPTRRRSGSPAIRLSPVERSRGWRTRGW